jgi:hypothetical protein
MKYSDNSDRNLHITVKRHIVQHVPQITNSLDHFFLIFSSQMGSVGMLSGKIDKFGDLHFLKIELEISKVEVRMRSHETKTLLTFHHNMDVSHTNIPR